CFLFIRQKVFLLLNVQLTDGGPLPAPELRRNSAGPPFGEAVGSVVKLKDLPQTKSSFDWALARISNWSPSSSEISCPHNACPTSLSRANSRTTSPTVNVRDFSSS